MVADALGRVLIGSKKRFFRQNPYQAGGEIEIPSVLPEEEEEVAEESPDQEVELVEAERVDAGPLAADGEDEDLEVAGGERGVKGLEKGGEAVDEVDLDGELVGVPDAVEEALPDLEEIAVGDGGVSLLG